MIPTSSSIPWLICLALVILVAYLCNKLHKATYFAPRNHKKPVTPDQALDRLIQGNNEYIQSGTSEFDRKNVAESQHPFAIILTCSDSRVSPELIFNQLHVGSLFVVRNAGNIVGNTVLGSIEFAVKYLETPLIIVLGHERCGAITAAVNAALENQTECSAHIQAIINIIKPVVDKTLQDTNLKKPISINNKNQILKKAAFENIHHVLQQISQDSPIISKAIVDKKVKLIGAYYDLDYGNLEFID